MVFVLGCCLGRPPPARACANGGKLLSQIIVSGEPQGLVCCPAKCAHGRSSNGKRNTATSQKHQPPRVPVYHWLGPLPVGVTGRKIEDTQPLSITPFAPETLQNSTSTRSPHRAQYAPQGILACACYKPTSEYTSHDPIVVV
jgi:hypothetical protein